MLDSQQNRVAPEFRGCYRNAMNRRQFLQQTSIAGASLAAAAPFSLLSGCAADDFWMNGSRQEAIPKGLFFEITGQWLNKLGISMFDDGKFSDYTICIAIFNPTDPSITAYNEQAGNGYDRRTYHSVLTWKPPTGKKSLAYEVDGQRREIRIANQLFDLKKSNFFVVIFSPAWVPTITQVREKLDIPPQLPADTIIELQKRFASKARKI